MLDSRKSQRTDQDQPNISYLLPFRFFTGTVFGAFVERDGGQFYDGLFFHLRRHPNDGVAYAQSRIFGHSTTRPNAAKQEISRPKQVQR